MRPAAIAVGLVAIVLASSWAVVAVMAPPASGKTGTGSGGCPSSNAIGNFASDPNLGAGFTIQGNGSAANYTFSSDNESPANGVPGLIEYCVYPAGGALPSSATTPAVGADGTPFTVHTGSHQSFFSFGRGKGNPSNIPFDGTVDVAMGNATWSGPAPTNQTILLHINDATECSTLYGANTSTCFVLPAMTGIGPCSTPGVAPDALHVSQSAPVSSAPTGSNVSSAYEFEVQNYYSGDYGAVVHVPTVTFVLPLSGSGTITRVVAPTTLNITGSGWSAPIGRSTLLAGATTFSSAKGWMTTSNLAVMASGGPSNLTLEFRWGWVVNESGTVYQSWTVPATSAKLPDHPSIILPAPYVSIVSTSSVTAAGGTYFSIVLSGAVGNTTFRTLVENLKGKEFRCQTQTNTGSGSSFQVGVPLTNPNLSALAPGHYLIHVHDAMGAIVRQVAITVT